MPQLPPIAAGRVTEWSYQAAKSYESPFADVTLDVIVTGPDGERRIPAFWAGGGVWRARFSSLVPGRYELRSECSETGDAGLHGVAAHLEVTEAQGNDLFAKGGIRVAEEGTHFVHEAAGIPFFWLADTWWNGFTRRLPWPDGMRRLTNDRVQKGFTVVQVCAAFPPIMDPMDPRAENETGNAWDPEFTSIRPEYFDAADLRLEHLVRSGLLPCILGCWGYNIEILGTEKMKAHWRYLVARWGAYPVVWCLSGEADMPWYLDDIRVQHQEQLAKWAEVGAYVRACDPYKRPLTIHPWTFDGCEYSAGRALIDDDLLDFDMLQTGHLRSSTIQSTVSAVRKSAARTPTKPVLNSEVYYEGIFGDDSTLMQRFLFWACLLSGARAGHTYGASGMWEMNTPDEPSGVSPNHINWSIDTWEEAMDYRGAAQLGRCKEFLSRFPWWRLEPRPDWLSVHWDGEPFPGPFAAGIPGELRIAYLPPDHHAGSVHDEAIRPRFLGLEPGVRYKATHFNPTNGERRPIGDVDAVDGEWTIPFPPVMRDWVVVLEAVEAGEMA